MPNPLLSLTPTQLHLVRGERRQQLIGYLKAWGEHATLLRYIEAWLGAQPDLATLRQARAETLIALDQPQAALAVLDELDAERSMTETRRQLRVAALAALQRWDAAHALLHSADHTRQRADLLRQQGRFAEAAQAYTGLGIVLNGSNAITTCAAEFAAAQGQWDAAREILGQRYRNEANYQPRTNELRLEHRIATALADQTALDQIAAELARREAEAQAALIEALNLHAIEGSDRIEPTFDPLPVDEPPPSSPQLDAAQAFLREHWGYTDFRGQQARVIDQMLRGRSTLAVLPTGAGKSLTYQLPAFLIDGATVVVSPLIALMKDQLDNLPPALRPQAAAINSSLRFEEVTAILDQMRAGQLKLIYVAPERMRQQRFVAALRAAKIARFVVDEAHCVSLWGLSFRPDYLFLARVLHELGNPPVLALTATATPETQQEIMLQLGKLHVVTASVFRPNLHFSVVPVANSDAKVEALIDVCQQTSGSVVVYARAREQCEQLAQVLRRNGVLAAHYHAGIDNRAAVQNQFMRGEVRVLVATIAFGMGVDKADVRMIVHYNLPQSVEAYYQEAGRAGRDGLPADCVLLYTPNDKGQLSSWLRQDALHKDDLRAVYRALRQHSQHDFAALPIESLQTMLPHFGETQLRVMLGMLERVGLVVRHFDLPRSMSVTLRDRSDDADLIRLANALVLQPGQRATVAPLPTAADCGWSPDALEARLLAWQAAGALHYSASGSDLLLELLPAPSDTAARIDDLLSNYEARQEGRIAAMVAYAKSLNCRHRALAAHFGERLNKCNGPCDVCAGKLPLNLVASAPLDKPAPLAGTAIAETILRTVRDLRFAVGRTGLAHILVGSPRAPISADRCRDWGTLGGYSRKAVIAFADALVELGFLNRSDDDERPVLRLSQHGRAALDTPATLPDLTPAPAAPAVIEGDDEDLYNVLAAWRRDVADEREIPQYIVFSNATLRAIASTRPRSLAQLGTIKGIGARKLDEFGAAVLALVEQHALVANE